MFFGSLFSESSKLKKVTTSSVVSTSTCSHFFLVNTGVSQVIWSISACGDALTFKGAGPVGLSERQDFTLPRYSPVQELLFGTRDDGFPLAVCAVKIIKFGTNFGYCGG